MSKRRPKTCQLPVLEPNAAGIDIGATSVFVAVPGDRDPHPIRSFATFTADLESLADWLQECGIQTVAMESRGVFWIPLFQILEKRNIQVLLVNAHHVKNVPGRKTDVEDCQWLQHLHAVDFCEDRSVPPMRFVRSDHCGDIETTSSSWQPFTYSICRSAWTR